MVELAAPGASSLLSRRQRENLDTPELVSGSQSAGSRESREGERRQITSADGDEQRPSGTSGILTIGRAQSCSTIVSGKLLSRNGSQTLSQRSNASQSMRSLPRRRSVDDEAGISPGQRAVLHEARTLKLRTEWKGFIQAARRRLSSSSSFQRPGNNNSHATSTAAAGHEEWEVHPEQEMDASTCSAEAINHLVQRCLHATRMLPFAKKRQISGLIEVETALQQTAAKMRAQETTLRKYADVPEIKQLLLALQDTLILLLRKCTSISKRKYFLDAAYGKRTMLFLQKLTSSTNELFMSLSRLAIVDSIEVQRRESVGSNESVRNILQQVRRLSASNLLRHRSSSSASTSASAARAIAGATSGSALEPASDALSASRSETAMSGSTPPTAPALPPKPRRLARLDAESPRRGAGAPTGAHSKVRFSRSTRSSASPRRPSLESTAPEALYDKGRLELLQCRHGHDGGDHRKAIVLLAKAAQGEHVPAMIALGQVYEEGLGGDAPDLDLARHFYTCAADANDADGMAALALFLLRHSSHDDESQRSHSKRAERTASIRDEALGLLKASVRKGSAQGACFLGELYASGVFVAQDIRKARALFATAAAKENSRAQNNLAVLLMDNDSASVEAERLLEISSAKGLAIAQNNLGLLLESSGRHAEACEAYEQAVAQNFVPAMSNLGYLVSLRAGNQRSQDAIRAMELLQAAAAYGAPEAHMYLGFLLDAKGAADEARASLHLQLGIEKLMNLDVRHPRSSEGMIARQDQAHRRHLATLGANRLADIYYRRREYPLATRWYRYAARLGSADAVNALGLMCESGKCSFDGVPDAERAVELYKAALAQGCADAGFNLAILALRRRSSPKVARNYLKSALALDPAHERALGLREEIDLL